MPKGIPPGAVVTEKGSVDTDWLVEDHKDLVYHLIHRTVRDRTAHEEIFQEVFLNVLESLPRFEGSSKLSTWIASITVHTCYKFIQKAGKRERTESFGDWLEEWPEPGVPPDLQENLERSDVRQRLERHLAELAPKYALPVTLFYFEGMNYREISEILEVPMGTVKSHLFRGLRELREKIEGGKDGFLLG
jgi:RNA polymerase sigma-70 factor (ECF subfamily)